mgnify:CR=1 FL=1
MIISRTPLRISFFGGGTDYPAWYENYGGGAVLSATINKYCYISCRYLPPFFDHKSKIVWSKIELVKNVDEIEHPAVKEVLKHLGMHEQGMEIHYNADLPARSGLGSSSAFTVGLLNALYALTGKTRDKQQLALEALYVEQKRIGESVGSQDQVAAAFGGLNKILFGGPEHVAVEPITVSMERMRELERYCMLFFTGLSRNAAEIAAVQIKNTPNKQVELMKMHAMVGQAADIVTGGHDLREFGSLLHESWQLKRGLTSVISNDHIDASYAKARHAGALGGKLLGAGGGGFILVFADPEKHVEIRKAMAGLLEIPFRFDHSGSQIVYRGYHEV